METQDMKILELNASKAGLEGVDKDRVNKIIQAASKGTPYYEHQQKRQQRINLRIESMLAELAQLTPTQLQASEQKMDALVEKMECSRDLSRIVVHVDMDAYFAAVEMRDDPSLRDKPMAVGSMGMLSTSNYEARKFGVRAAMPGFIGKKLCPSLLIVRPNFNKYCSVSAEVRKVMARYDEDFMPVGLDEAYLDITDHVNATDADPEDIVREMRNEIFEATQLTASAGIAPNMFLAKVCSDIRKPNNQFRLPNDINAVREFVRTLPIRKVPGIGAVQEQLLRALGAQTCHDLWVKRAAIGHLFGMTSARFYLRAALGLGCTEVKCDSARKSKSVEETFSELSSPEALVSKCEELCEQLCEQVEDDGITGRVVTLKIKTVAFDVMTRSVTLDSATNRIEPIKKAALRLLRQEIAAAKPDCPLRLRLMGVRLSGLNDGASSSASQPTLSSFLSGRTATTCPVCGKTLGSSSSEFVNAHLDSCLRDASSEPAREEDVESASRLAPVKVENSDETDNNTATPGSPITDGPSTSSTPIQCPVCGQAIQETDWSKVNGHIDACLNRPAIREMLSSQTLTPASGKRTETARSQRSKKRPKSSQSDEPNRITKYLSPSTSKA
ncbi:DNA polymerase IV isoform X2 [Ixodes scapularis]